MRTPITGYWRACALVMLSVVCGAVGVLAWSGAFSRVPGGANANVEWGEIAWPYPTAPWEASRAFKCVSSRCVIGTIVLVQAKIGFCNCATGVADDEELERVSDLQLVGSHYAPMSAGREITVSHMKGRSRHYRIADSGSQSQAALSVAFNDRCDVIVATAILDHLPPTSIEPAVLEFLNSKTIVNWAERVLGL